MTELSLSELYETHTGKQSDKWSGYLPVYERVLGPYRERQVRLLEIGVQNGGSLELWSRYFPNATKFVGCDIDPACGMLLYDDPRIHVVVGDATGEDAQQTISRISETFDIVIDDGSHLSSDIVLSFCHYFQMLAPDGIYIAEDLHCSYWMEYEGGLNDPTSSISFFKALVDFVHRNHWGLPADHRDTFLEPFTLRFGDIDFDPDEIASVEFYDSVCVIRKRGVGSARLGGRVVRGSVAAVKAGIESLDGTTLSALDQRRNPFSSPIGVAVSQRHADIVRELTATAQRQRERHVEEIGALTHKLQELDQDRARLQASISGYSLTVAALRNSLSWRITAPLRLSLTGLKRAKWGADYVRSLFNLGGGPLKTFALLVGVLRREGWDGVRWRLKNARKLMTESPGQVAGNPANDYSEWVRRFDNMSDAERDRIRNEIRNLSVQTSISVIMSVYNPPVALLDEAIWSVRRQLYPNWELCIADDASSNEAVRDVLRRHAGEDSRIKFVFRTENGHISAASNSALELATGEFVALMDHDDLLPQHALFWVADAIHRHPDVQLIYSDEDKITKDGARYDPYFKCELNPELLLAQNMISHLGVYHRVTLMEIGGFREGFEGAQDYDLALRVIERVGAERIVHIPRVLYHWRAIPGSTALACEEKSYAAEAGRRAIRDYLARQGDVAEVMPAPDAPGMTRVRYALPQRPPMVSILIPTRDKADLLERCIASIRSRSTWQRYEIVIVDNGSVEPVTFALFERVQGGDVRIVRDDAPFNFSALNNRAALEARGEVLCLLNNDIEVVTPDWLEEMLSFVMRPEIGCVGARLWYPDGCLQHGGVILGVRGVAGHAHKYLSPYEVGYFSRAKVHQCVSAVTGACMMVRKQLYADAGGFDEQLAVAFNDIDFCLRIQRMGYRNVWTPYAELVHHESLSRGIEDSPEKKARFEAEVNFMLNRWKKELLSDPAYSPNLTLDYEDFSLAWPPRTIE